MVLEDFWKSWSKVRHPPSNAIKITSDTMLWSSNYCSFNKFRLHGLYLHLRLIFHRATFWDYFFSQWCWRHGIFKWPLALPFWLPLLPMTPTERCDVKLGPLIWPRNVQSFEFVLKLLPHYILTLCPSDSRVEFDNCATSLKCNNIVCIIIAYLACLCRKLWIQHLEEGEPTTRWWAGLG